jgi:lysophospholipid acyltransferase (LPLAT)-like uncharacterized protein
MVPNRIKAEKPDASSPMPLLTHLAEAWGREIYRYSRWVVSSATITFEGELPSESFIGVTWHSMNLLTLAVHAERRPHPYRAFVPPGLAGSTMRGWLVASGMEPVPLPAEGTGNPIAGLRQMARALSEGLSVGIALDGPHGPPRVLRPGALWLARLSGKPLVVMGYAAKPGFAAPRWDRQLVPLPSARIAVVYGEPIIVERQAEIDEALRSHVSNAVDAAERRAWAMLDSPSRGPDGARTT